MPLERACAPVSPGVLGLRLSGFVSSQRSGCNVDRPYSFKTSEHDLQLHRNGQEARRCIKWTDWLLHRSGKAEVAADLSASLDPPAQLLDRCSLTAAGAAGVVAWAHSVPQVASMVETSCEHCSSWRLQPPTSQDEVHHRDHCCDWTLCAVRGNLGRLRGRIAAVDARGRGLSLVHGLPCSPVSAAAAETETAAGSAGHAACSSLIPRVAAKAKSPAACLCFR